MKSLLILCGALTATVLMAGCNPNRSSSLMNNKGNTGQTQEQPQQQQPGVAASPQVNDQNQIKNPDVSTNQHDINAGANP